MDRVGQRSLELIECPLFGLYDIEHLQGIHRYLFQDVYEWAGEFRTADIAKGNSYFAHVPISGGVFEQGREWTVTVWDSNQRQGNVLTD
jgi:Fic/DOC family